MNTRLCFALLLGFLELCALPGAARAQSSAFTYQGRLQDQGAPANGAYDLSFTLYDAATQGTVLGGPVTNNGVAVADGVFTVLVDFGVGAFLGGSPWLAVAVSPHGSNTFAALDPRQPVSSAPYAVFAGSASNLVGKVSSSQLTGLIPAASISGMLAPGQLPSVVLTNGAGGASLSGTFGGTFAGDGAGVTNLNAASLAGTLPDSALSSNVLVIQGLTTLQTNLFATAGVYNVTVPYGATRLVAKVWGAGGGGPHQQYQAGSGGGGAFAQTTFPVAGGQVLTVVVGQRGGSGGGEGSGNAAGGPVIQAAQGNGHSAHGGQGSSVFFNAGTNLVLKALAGGGGGGGGFGQFAGAGGNPGAGGNNGGAGGVDGHGGVGSPEIPESRGQDYAANATTTGIGTLSSAGGAGGLGNVAGSGGGGYGGGAGGGKMPPIYSGGGSGGGSYGDVVVDGFFATPGNASDVAYISPAGRGDSVAGGSDGDGLVVLSFQMPGVGVPALLSAVRLTGNGEGVSNVVASGVLPGTQLNGVSVTNSFFAGDGARLANLDASQLTSGTVPLARIPAPVLTNGATGVALGGSFSGTVSGDGSALSHLNASQLNSGTVPVAQLPAAVVLNNAVNLTLGGTFNGSFSGALNTTQASGLTLAGTMNANSNPIFLRAPNDATCGLAYSFSYSPFWFQIDGPVLWGKSGGMLGTTDGNGNTTTPLQWTTKGVSVIGTFNNFSDRNAKQDIRSVTPARILDRVLSLPVSEWSYRTDAATRHIGPMAQDFFAAFEVGTDDKHIAPIDEGGVALAAIQGLHQRLDQKLADKDAEIAELRRTVAELKKLVERLAEKN